MNIVSGQRAANGFASHGIDLSLNDAQRASSATATPRASSTDCAPRAGAGRRRPRPAPSACSSRPGRDLRAGRHADRQDDGACPARCTRRWATPCGCSGRPTTRTCSTPRRAPRGLSFEGVAARAGAAYTAFGSGSTASRCSTTSTPWPRVAPADASLDAARRRRDRDPGRARTWPRPQRSRDAGVMVSVTRRGGPATPPAPTSAKRAGPTPSHARRAWRTPWPAAWCSCPRSCRWPMRGRFDGAVSRPAHAAMRCANGSMRCARCAPGARRRAHRRLGGQRAGGGGVAAVADQRRRRTEQRWHRDHAARAGDRARRTA